MNLILIETNQKYRVSGPSWFSGNQAYVTLILSFGIVLHRPQAHHTWYEKHTWTLGSIYDVRIV